MKDALAPYFGKRDFSVTASRGRQAGAGKALAFVIQKHAARACTTTSASSSTAR